MLQLWVPVAFCPAETGASLSPLLLRRSFENNLITYRLLSFRKSDSELPSVSFSEV